MSFPFRRKFNNTWKVCHQGHKHHSIKEANYCDTLATLLKAKVIKHYETQVPYVMWVNDKKICTHIVDFVVTKNNGDVEVRETKGMKTSTYNLKHKLFLALYPDIPYEIN
jgi:hypothetical protein